MIFVGVHEFSSRLTTFSSCRRRGSNHWPLDYKSNAPPLHHGGLPNNKRWTQCSINKIRKTQNEHLNIVCQNLNSSYEICKTFHCFLKYLKTRKKFFWDFLTFTNYFNTYVSTLGDKLGVVHKLRLQDEVGRLSINVHFFCQRLYHRKCQLRVLGGQRKSKCCQRSLWTTLVWKFTCQKRIYFSGQYLWFDNQIIIAIQNLPGILSK